MEKCTDDEKLPHGVTPSLPCGLDIRNLDRGEQRYFPLRSFGINWLNAEVRPDLGWCEGEKLTIELMEQDKLRAVLNGVINHLGPRRMEILSRPAPGNSYAFEHFALPQLYPSTFTTGIAADLFVDLFNDSGFFALQKGKASMGQAIQKWKDFSRTLASRREIGFRASVFTGQRLEGGISSVKLNSSTWSVRELARYPGLPAGGFTSAGVLLVLQQFALEMPMYLDPAMEYVLVYFASTGFAKNAWQAFARTQPAHKTRIDKIHLVRGRTETVLGRSNSASPVETRLATAEEIHHLWRRLSEGKDELQWRPMGWDEEQLAGARTPGICQDLPWAPKTVLVATRDSKVLAFAIAEAGPDGASMVNLSDSIFLHRAEADSDDALEALIVEGAHLYQSMGKGSFCYIAEEATWPHALRLGMTDDKGCGGRWTMGDLQEMVPAYLGFLESAFQEKNKLN